MTVDFQQTNTTATHGPDQYCSPTSLSPNPAPTPQECAVGGVGGGTTSFRSTFLGNTRSFYFESKEGDLDGGFSPEGTWTVRFNVTTGLTNCNLTRVDICRLNNGGATLGTVGFWTGSVDFGTTGVKTIEVDGLRTPATGDYNTGDRFIIIGSTTGSGSGQGFIALDQVITAQLLTVGPPVEVDVDPGSLSFSGENIEAAGSSSGDVSPGALSLSGEQINAAASAPRGVDPGSLSLTGEDIEPLVTEVRDVSPGTLGLTGENITGEGVATSSVAPGSLSFTGQDIEAEGNITNGSVAPGSLTFTGENITAAVPGAEIVRTVGAGQDFETLVEWRDWVNEPAQSGTIEAIYVASIVGNLTLAEDTFINLHASTPSDINKKVIRPAAGNEYDPVTNTGCTIDDGGFRFVLAEEYAEVDFYIRRLSSAGGLGVETNFSTNKVLGCFYESTTTAVGDPRGFLGNGTFDSCIAYGEINGGFISTTGGADFRFCTSLATGVGGFNSFVSADVATTVVGCLGYVAGVNFGTQFNGTFSPTSGYNAALGDNTDIPPGVGSVREPKANIGNWLNDAGNRDARVPDTGSSSYQFVALLDEVVRARTDPPDITVVELHGSGQGNPNCAPYNGAIAVGAVQADVDPGTLTFTGQVMTASATASADVNPGTLSLTGEEITAQGLSGSLVSPGSLAFAGQEMTAAASADADVDPGSLTFVGETITAAELTAGQVNPGSLTLTGQQIEASGSSDVQVQINFGDGVQTGYAPCMIWLDAIGTTGVTSTADTVYDGTTADILEHACKVEWTVLQEPAGSDLAAQMGTHPEYGHPIPMEDLCMPLRYDVPGDYQLECTVTDPDGNTGTATTPVFTILDPAAEPTRFEQTVGVDGNWQQVLDAAKASYSSGKVAIVNVADGYTETTTYSFGTSGAQNQWGKFLIRAAPGSTTKPEITLNVPGSAFQLVSQKNFAMSGLKLIWDGGASNFCDIWNFGGESNDDLLIDDCTFAANASGAATIVFSVFAAGTNREEVWDDVLNEPNARRWCFTRNELLSADDPADRFTAFFAYQPGKYPLFANNTIECDATTAWNIRIQTYSHCVIRANNLRRENGSSTLKIYQDNVGPGAVPSPYGTPYFTPGRYLRIHDNRLDAAQQHELGNSESPFDTPGTGQIGVVVKRNRILRGSVLFGNNKGTFVNNVVGQNDSFLQLIHWPTFHEVPTSARILNNTFVSTNGSTTTPIGLVIQDLSSPDYEPGDWEGILAKGNIVTATTQYFLIGLIGKFSFDFAGQEDLIQTELTSDYNTVHNMLPGGDVQGTNPPFATTSGSNISGAPEVRRGLDNWQTNYGQDANSNTDNPNLVDVAGGDYSATATTPTLPTPAGVHTDIAGVTIDQATTQQGAFLFVSSVPEVSPGSLSLTGQSITASASGAAAVDPGVLAFTGQVIAASRLETASIGPGTLTLAGEVIEAIGTTNQGFVSPGLLVLTGESIIVPIEIGYIPCWTGEFQVNTVDVWNLALTVLGKPPVNSTEDDTPQARLLKRVWAPVRRALLEHMPVEGSKKTVNLNLVEGTPLDRWSYKYEKPYDCIRPWAINGNQLSPQPGHDWELEVRDDNLASYILSDEPPPARLEYIIDQCNMDQLGPNTVMAMAESLALFVAPSVGKDEASIQRFFTNYRLRFGDMQKVESQKHTPYKVADDDLIRSRGSGAYRRDPRAW